MAAAPATCGVAMEVPLIPTYAPSPALSAERAAVMSLPGPTMSGLSAPDRDSGPWLENHESVPEGSSTEPTVSADAAEAGEPIVSGEEEFPAATTNSAPVSSAIRLSDAAMRSVPSEASGEPRLIDTIGARWAAHSM